MISPFSLPLQLHLLLHLQWLLLTFTKESVILSGASRSFIARGEVEGPAFLLPSQPRFQSF